MSGCCNEPGCRRKKPMRIYQGGLSDTWYVVTDYHHLRDGTFRADQRHVLPVEDAALLNTLLSALDLAREAREVLDQMDLHGRSKAGRLRMKLRGYFDTLEGGE